MCDFCKAVETMKQVMELVEQLPEFNVPLYDDVITKVYEAADDASGILKPWPGGQPTPQLQPAIE